MKTLIRSVLFAAFAAVAMPMAAQSDPDLVVEKTGPAQATAGSDVTYTITVRNIGTAVAENVQLTDAVPPGMTFQSFAQNSGPNFNCATPAQGDPGTVTCTIASFNAGDAATFTLVTHIPANTAAGTFFTNVASVTTTTPESNDENNQGFATTSTPPAPTADLAVTKQGPTAAAPGGNVTYTITLTNASANAATNVTLTDTLPTAPSGAMTFVSLQQSNNTLSCTTPAIGAHGTITCTAASFPANTSTVLTLTTNVPPEATAGTTYVNNVSVTSGNDPNEENNAGSTTLTVSAADLEVTKSGPATVTAGAPITYTVTVTNNGGPHTALDVFLFDELPAGTRFQSIVQTSGPPMPCQAPAVNSSGTIICSIENFAPNQSVQFTITVTAPANGGSAINNARVTSRSHETDPPDNQASVTTTVTASADLAVAKSGPASATAGDNATYTITVTNNGPSTATNVTLTDALPANTTFVSIAQNSGPAFSCTTPAAGANGTVTCTIASLASAGTATFTLVARVQPSATGNVQNTASVGSSTSDPAPANNTSSVTTPITTSADLGVTKNGPATATAGQNVIYTISATNAGPSTAANVTLTDALPANTTFVSIAQNSGPTFSCTTPAAGANGTVTCTTASLDPSVTALFTLTVNVSPGATGTISNTAAISAATPDPSNTNNNSTVVTTLGASADVAVTKSGPATVRGGENITYTIAVTNNGPSNASNVTLTDTVPTGTSYVSITQNSGPTFSCTAPAVGASGTVTCSTGTLASGATALFTLVVSTPAGATGTINNTATVNSSTPDPSNTNNTSTVTTTYATADLGVTKSGPATVRGGENITYTIAVANNGPSDALSVTLTDAVPAGTTFVSITQNSGPTFSCTAPAVGSGGTVTCTIGTFTSGATASFTLVVSTPAGATGTINNTATINSSTPDPSNANDTSTVTTALSTADLAVTKSGPAAVIGGENISYAIGVANNGPSDAINVTLTDTLPSGTGFVSIAQNSGPTFSCTAPAVGAGGTVTCTIGTLTNGATASFTLVVSTAATASGPIENTATINSTTPDLASGNNTATTSTVAGTGATDLRISKSVTPTTALPQSNATFNIVVTNDGPNPAVNTVVTDVLPPGTTYVSSSASQGSCTGTTTVTCTLGVVPANATATVTIVVRLPSTPSSVSNTATVAATNAETDAGDNASTAAVAVANPEAIPALSPLALIGLAFALGMAALWVQRISS